MTDEIPSGPGKQAPAEASEQEAELKWPQNPFDVPDDQDWLLAQLVRYVNFGLSLGITLVVDGATITGTMIGGKAYFEGMAGGFRRGTGDQSLGDSFAKMIESYIPLYETQETEDGNLEFASDGGPPRYIHLEDARVLTPSGETPTIRNGDIFWRGKLADVSGFWLGEFNRT